MSVVRIVAITRRKFVLRTINLGDRLTVVYISGCYVSWRLPRGMIGKNNLEIGGFGVGKFRLSLVLIVCL